MKFLSVLIHLIVGFALASHAEVITLSNASFETGISGTQNVAGSGWFTFLSGNIASGVDITAFWNMSNADGPNAAYATSLSATDGGMLYQSVELDAGKAYDFTVGVGMSSAAPKNDGNFSLVIYNQPFSSLLASTTGTITDRGSFTDYSVSYTPTTTGIYHVGVRTTGYVVGSGANNNETTIFYDNARLTSAIPEPQSLALFSMAMGAFWWVCRKRQSS